MTSRYDQRGQEVSTQFNINRATLLVVSDGFLGALHNYSKAQVVEALEACLAALPRDSPNRDLLNKLIQELKRYSGQEWNTFIALDKTAPAPIQGMRELLGLLVLSFLIGSTAILWVVHFRKQGSRQEPIITLDDEEGDEPRILQPSQRKTMKDAADSLYVGGVTVDQVDNTGFSYYLIGCAQGQLLKGATDCALEMMDFAFRIDPNNPFLSSSGIGASADRTDADIQAEIDLAEIHLSNEDVSMVPISNAAAEAIASGGIVLAADLFVNLENLLAAEGEIQEVPLEDMPSIMDGGSDADEADGS